VVYTSMQQVETVCRESKDLKKVLKSPIINTEKKLKIIEKIFSNHIDQVSLKFLLIITRKNREGIIPEIAEEYVVFYKAFKNILTVILKTTASPGAELKKEIVGMLGEKTGKTIELVEEVQEDLIGGFILRFEDYQYDTSVVRKLNDLKQEVAKINLYVKGF